MSMRKFSPKEGNQFKFFSENNIPLFEVRPNEKRPKHKGWQNNAVISSPTDNRFNSMIANDSNLGAAIPKGILVLDFDERNGGIDSLKKLNNLLGYDLIEVGPTVCTPNKGFHIYCCFHDLEKEFRGKLDSSEYPGVDIRKHGNLVVIPPSRIDGTYYSWHPASMDDQGEIACSLLELPAELLPLVEKPESTSKRINAVHSSAVKSVAGPIKGAISALEAKTILDRLDVKKFRSREDWRNLMLSLHSATDGDSRAGEHFIEWSALDPKYADAGLMNQHRNEWNSADADGGIGPATLIHQITQFAIDPETPELAKILKKIRSMLDSADFTDFDNESDRSLLSWLNDQHNWTENVLAEKFIDQFGAEIRYVPTWKKWMHYDGTRWVEAEESVFVGQAARKFANSLWDFMKAVSQAWDAARLKSVFNFIRMANSAKGITNAMNLSKSDSRVLVKVEGWNKDDNLLNVVNGTINLSRGEFQQHAASDLISLIANVRFEEGAKAPKWEEALDLIFEGNQELIRYVQQLLGYSLTAIVAKPFFRFALAQVAKMESQRSGM